MHPGHFILISSNYFYLCSWFWYRLTTTTKSLTAWNVVIRTNYNFIDLPGLTATSHPVKNLHFVLDLRLIGRACYSTHMHELFNYPLFLRQQGLIRFLSFMSSLCNFSNTAVFHNRQFYSSNYWFLYYDLKLVLCQ